MNIEKLIENSMVKVKFLENDLKKIKNEVRKLRGGDE